jgi:hypothetical protein
MDLVRGRSLVSSRRATAIGRFRAAEAAEGEGGCSTTDFSDSNGKSFRKADSGEDQSSASVLPWMA